ncbi:hypothetical protein DLAC_00604 [Tieghemostelium lacteum]|uniref:Uncharacterized protein n=1 Tax=Tieghemostelium lacteum TaxID=361077 RepID=A0A152AA60_TIELA|nr:hypothetical protein DLAC_00604 [Tieghemostelium lacteum]|eukprot:KYR03109.1 hypothetical protein DLAC_00604 [Tieghemostelium lacteum]
MGVVSNLIVTKILQNVIDHMKFHLNEKSTLSFIQEFYFICHEWTESILKKKIVYKKVTIYSEEDLLEYERIYKLGFHNINVIFKYYGKDLPVKTLSQILPNIVKMKNYKLPLEFSDNGTKYQFTPRYIATTKRDYLIALKKGKLFDRFPNIKKLSLICPSNYVDEDEEFEDIYRFDIDGVTQVPEHVHLDGFDEFTHQLNGLDIFESWNGSLKSLKISGITVESYDDLCIDLQQCKSITKLNLNIDNDENKSNLNVLFHLFGKLPNLQKLVLNPHIPESYVSAFKFIEFILTHHNITDISLFNVDVKEDGKYANQLDTPLANHKQSLKKIRMVNAKVPLENMGMKKIMESLDFIKLQECSWETMYANSNPIMDMSKVKSDLSVYNREQVQWFVLSNPLQWTITTLDIQEYSNGHHLTDIFNKNLPSLTNIHFPIDELENTCKQQLLEAIVANKYVTSIKIRFTNDKIIALEILETILKKPQIKHLSVRESIFIDREKICNLLETAQYLQHFQYDGRRSGNIQSQIKKLHLD